VHEATCKSHLQINTQKTEKALIFLNNKPHSDQDHKQW